MGLGAENPGMRKLDDLFAKGALKGKAGAIVETALRNNVDPKLFAAVIAHETGRGTSNLVKSYNNPAGIMDPKHKWMKPMVFRTLQDGLEYSAKNLGRRLDETGGNMEGLQKAYAPLNAPNDPKGLNRNWLQGVNKFYNLLEAKETPEGDASQDNSPVAK